MISITPRATMQSWRTPRGLAVVNGTTIPVFQFSVNQNNFTQADTFDVYTQFDFLDSGGNDWLSSTPSRGTEFLQQDTVNFEVWVGYPMSGDNWSKSDLTRILYGRLDTIDFSGSSQGEVIHLSGRNMVGPMIDEQQQYMQVRNMTGSGLAQSLATKYGLQAKITPTTTLLGTYYNQENLDLTTNASEWDMLVNAASFDQYICRVYDDTLYYGPSSLIVSLINSKPRMYTWGWNIQDFDITRSPTGVQDITVTVKSYDVEYKKMVTGVAKSHATKVKSASTGNYTETLIWPGLTQAQAQAKAESLLKQLSEHAIQGTITVEGDPNAQVDGRTQVYGLGQGLDQEYYNQKITHNYNVPQLGQGAQSGNSTTDGYLCTISVSNQLIMDQTQSSNPLGLGSPTTGQVTTTDIPGVNNQSASSAGGVSYPPPTMPSATTAKVQNWIAQALQITGTNASVWGPGMMWLVQHESGGDPTARNATSVETAPGRWEHAYGLGQVMPSTFNEYAMPGHTNIANPVDNLIASIGHIKAAWGNVNKITGIGTSAYGGY